MWTEVQIDELITWLYILFLGLGFITVFVIIFLITSFIFYVRTGVHVRKWIEEKFPSE